MPHDVTDLGDYMWFCNRIIFWFHDLQSANCSSEIFQAACSSVFYNYNIVLSHFLLPTSGKQVYHFCLWILASTVVIPFIPTLSVHLLPSLNPISASFVGTHWIYLFVLTVGELHRWLNSSSCRIGNVSDHSRKGTGLCASCLSQGENCFCSHHFLLHTCLLGPGARKEEVNQRERC